MDYLINPIELRHPTFGQVDRYSQEGSGILSSILNIFRKVAPVLKNVAGKVAKNKIVRSTAKQLGEAALQAGVNASTSAFAGENVADGLKKDLSEAGNIGLQGLDKLAHAYVGTQKRKSSDSYSSSTKKKRKNKKKKKDLFM